VRGYGISHQISREICAMVCTVVKGTFWFLFLSVGLLCWSCFQI